MTDTPTREQVEAIKGHHCPDYHSLNALCDLALEALEMRPRPISEAPRTGARLLIKDAHGDWCDAYWKPAADAFCDESSCYPYATHFIPLSSLPKVTP